MLSRCSVMLTFRVKLNYSGYLAVQMTSEVQNTQMYKKKVIFKYVANGAIDRLSILLIH